MGISIPAVTTFLWKLLGPLLFPLGCGISHQYTSVWVFPSYKLCLASCGSPQSGHLDCTFREIVLGISVDRSQIEGWYGAFTPGAQEQLPRRTRRPNARGKKFGKPFFEKHHKNFLYQQRKLHHERRLLVYANDINLLTYFLTCSGKNMEGIYRKSLRMRRIRYKSRWRGQQRQRESSRV